MSDKWGVYVNEELIDTIDWIPQKETPYLEAVGNITESVRRRSMVEDKINLFLEELEKRFIEINGETAFICNDGAVLFVPNEEGGVDISVVRNPVHIDYDLGITDEDIALWKAIEEIMEEE